MSDMNDMKYIHFEDLGLVIFENVVEHARMARTIGKPVLSAGFCFLPAKDDADNPANCYGKSISNRETPHGSNGSSTPSDFEQKPVRI